MAAQRALHLDLRWVVQRALLTAALSALPSADPWVHRKVAQRGRLLADRRAVSTAH